METLVGTCKERTSIHCEVVVRVLHLATWDQGGLCICCCRPANTPPPNFKAPTEPFGKPVVQLAACAVHTDLVAMVFQEPCELLAGELAVLVGVEDVRSALAGQSFGTASRPKSVAKVLERCHNRPVGLPNLGMEDLEIRRVQLVVCAAKHVDGLCQQVLLLVRDLGGMHAKFFCQLRLRFIALARRQGHLVLEYRP
jgi:hypothetical protein